MDYRALPEDLEAQLNDEIEEFVEEQKMPYVTSWERRGERRGIEMGERTGRISLLLMLLKRRIGAIDATAREKIEALSVAQMDRLAEALLDFTQPADLERWLARRKVKSREA